MEIEGKFLDLMEFIYNKHTANTILNGGKLTAFPTKMRTAHYHRSLFNIVLEVLSIAIRQKKERDIDWKRRNQTVTICR